MLLIKMSKKGTLAGIIIAVAAVAGIIVYTNIDELAKPSVDSSIDTAKEVASKVEGKDVVSKAEEVVSEVKNVTSKIEIQNPLEPKK